MTISEFIKSAFGNAALSVSVAYAHPTLYIFCVSERFAGKLQESRLEILAELAGLTLSDLESITGSPMIELLPVTEHERTEEYGYLDLREAEVGWLSAFSPISPLNASTLSTNAVNTQDEGASIVGPNGSSIKAIHFYGYKGGQG